MHGEEPYAPRAKIRTEVAAITVAERWHERDGHIHHPRSFEYRGAERRTRRDDKREDGWEGRWRERTVGSGERRKKRTTQREKERLLSRAHTHTSSLVSVERNTGGRENERDGQTEREGERERSDDSARRGRRRRGARSWKRGGEKPVTEEVNTRR